MIIVAANKPPSKILRIGSPLWVEKMMSKRRQSHTCSKDGAYGTAPVSKIDRTNDPRQHARQRCAIVGDTLRSALVQSRGDPGRGIYPDEVPVPAFSSRIDTLLGLVAHIEDVCLPTQLRR
jgi:hypothetical protein